MKFRRAFHTHQLTKQVEFYTQIVGLEILGEFKNHDGYDGAFLGKHDLNWELEFTQSEEIAKRLFDEDDLLVFYPTTLHEFDTIRNAIKRNNILIYQPKNPYWTKNGIYIKDVDGFGIVIGR